MAKDFVFVSVTLSHLEWKSGRKRMGPLASQEVEGREERMEEMKVEWRERRSEGTPTSSWSLVTKVTLGEEETREVREIWEEESSCGREEEEKEGLGKAAPIAGKPLELTVHSGGFDRLNLNIRTTKSESETKKIKKAVAYIKDKYQVHA